MRILALRLSAGTIPTLLALALSACGGSDDSSGGPPPPPPDVTPPTVPTGVTAAALSSTQVMVSWTASTDSGAGIAGYHVFRDGAAAPVASVTTTNFTDSNLTANTSYTYAIRAFDAAVPSNESGLSTAASASTPPMPVLDTTPPTVPTNLAGNPISPTQVQLTWTASTDAGTGVAGYHVFRNGGATAIAVVNAGTTYTDNGLTANTAYTYTLSAFDAATPANESALTTGVPVTTLAVADTTPPTTPAGLTATAQSSTQIRLSWSAATDSGSGIGGYRVFRNANGSGTALATVTATNFADSGLTANSAYTYTVRAIDQATPPNVSAASASATATTLAAADTTAPTVPTNVAATAQSNMQIRITWSPSTDTGTGVGGYRIFRDGSTTALATVTSTNYTDSGLTASTLYSYKVSAFDLATPTANPSALSLAATATTLATPDTTVPTLPTNVAATAQSSTQIRITWSPSTDTGTGVGGYHIFRNNSTTALATVTAANYTDSGLTAGTLYSYKVSAFDLATPTANESALSSAASATTLPAADTTAPTVPGSVAATAQSSSQIRIIWSPSTDTGTGVGGYHIFRNNSTTALASVTATNYTDSGLTAATLYSYKVSAFDLATPTANESALSLAATATTQAASNPSSGLDTRPSNTTCLAGAPPSQSASFVAQRQFGSLSFSAAVAIMQAPGDNSKWYVVQQGGVVKKFNNVDSPGTPANFIDVSSKLLGGPGSERGLLGMAFHPNFPSDPRVYLYYTANNASLGGGVDRLSEFTSSDGGATLNAASETILFDVTDPEDNHNGGNIMFGPDGYLYIGIGDGGGGNDQHGSIGNSQNLMVLKGKMLRIAVGASAGQAYTIPADNPFTGGARCNVNGSSTANCPEIYAYGMRNPWRWSFDRGTGDLWVGDVGEDAWEEIDKVTKGGNYGWRCYEGNHTTNNTPCGPEPNPQPPIAEIAHPTAIAITGGYVYRGSAMPGLNGKYIFGDFSAGLIWSIPNTTTPTLTVTGSTGQSSGGANISGFGEDQAGEIYFLDYNGGVSKLVPSGGGGGTVASLLSQTGCANTTNPKLPASGMIPYAPNAPFWSDGAIKTRWLALPNGANINIDATSNDWDLPNGSVLRKDFMLNTTMAETRLFMHHTDGSWAGYTYQWNAQGTEATRVVGGLTTTINGQTWEFPSEANCLQCHTAAAGRTLGLETGQLNGDLLYPTTGRTANQVFTLNFIDTLRPVITLPVDQLPVIPNPFGTAGTQSDRARAWLHSNCSNCHRPSGGTPVNLDFRYTTSLMGTNACEAAPTTTDLGIANAKLIAVGDASRSVVVARVNLVGTNAMPPLARHSIDTQGVALLTAWINSLTSCN